MISDEAVQAAAKALWAKQGGTVLDESHYQEARAALQAAAPYIAAHAWDEAYKQAVHDLVTIQEAATPNPYRSQV